MAKARIELKPNDRYTVIGKTGSGKSQFTTTLATTVVAEVNKTLRDDAGRTCEGGVDHPVHGAHDLLHERRLALGLGLLGLGLLLLLGRAAAAIARLTAGRDDLIGAHGPGLAGPAPARPLRGGCGGGGRRGFHPEGGRFEVLGGEVVGDVRHQ